MDKKSLRYALVGLLLGTPLAASADGVTLYGDIDMSMDFLDLAGGSSPPAGSGDTSTINPNFSTIGIRGSESIGGLTAIFNLGFSINPDSAGSDPNGTPIGGNREQWLGIQTEGLGTLRFGTVSTAYKQYGAKVDPFHGTALDGRNIGTQSALHNEIAGDDGQGLASNTIAYTSPSIHGITIDGHYTFNQTTGDDGFGGGVSYENGPLFVGAAWQTSDDGGDDSAWKISAKYGVNVVGFPLVGFFQFEVDDGLLSSAEAINPVTGTTTLLGATPLTANASNSVDGADTWFLGAMLDLDSFKFVGQFGRRVASSVGTNDQDTWSLAMDYYFSKRTHFYAGYVRGNEKLPIIRNRVPDLPDPTVGSTYNLWTFGLGHSF